MLSRRFLCLLTISIGDLTQAGADWHQIQIYSWISCAHKLSSLLHSMPVPSAPKPKTSDQYRFIQRRGRARRPNSYFVLMVCPTEPVSKLSKWLELEEAMQNLSSQQRPEVKSAGVDDGAASERVFHVKDGDAVLTIESARQHLQHFCATLPRDNTCQIRKPTYLLTREIGDGFSCRVILPPCLPENAQKTSSVQNWLTEKDAKADAAFEAYVKLYHCGLVNDHLLPHKAGLGVGPSHDHAASMCDIDASIDVWSISAEWIEQRKPMYGHRLILQGLDTTVSKSCLLLLLPIELRVHDVVLYHNSQLTLTAKVQNIGKPSDIPSDLAVQSTKLLLSAVLGRRLPGLMTSKDHLPFFLIPELSVQALHSWLSTSRRNRTLEEVLSTHTVEDPVLVKHKNEVIPYIYNPRHARLDTSADTKLYIHATMLTRRINFLKPTNKAPEASRILQVKECSVLGLPPRFAETIVLLPSLLFEIQLAFKAQLACLGPLAPLCLDNSSNITRTLCVPGVTSFNFERLEFIGDSLLKFLSSVQLFCHQPASTAAELSQVREKLVSNENLRSKAIQLDLAKFISTESFSKQWPLTAKLHSAQPRQSSSKLPADIVEAIIGTAFHHSGCNLAQLDSTVQALALFLPERKWELPAAMLSLLPTLPTTTALNPDKIAQVESILSYNFTDKTLLASALTHPSSGSDIPNYDRLEFLGDAIIDIIVKTQLYNSPRDFNEGEMSIRTATLVNKDIFAYLMTKACCIEEHNDVTIDWKTRTPAVVQKGKRVSLHEYVSLNAGFEMVQQRLWFMERFFKERKGIEEALHQEWGNDGSEWLNRLKSPKWISDAFESMVAAVFVDSGGDIGTCVEVVDRLGLGELIERAVK